MIDTNVFNRILDGSFKFKNINRSNLFITRVQIGEIEDTKCDQRRLNLLNVIEMFSPNIIPVSFAMGIKGAGFGEGEWSNDPVIYNKIITRVLELDNLKHRKRPKEGMQSKNQIKDALIAEASIRNNFTILSFDEHLVQATIEYGGNALAPHECSEYYYSTR